VLVPIRVMGNDRLYVSSEKVTIIVTFTKCVHVSLELKRKNLSMVWYTLVGITKTFSDLYRCTGRR
jgi:hypothetical protein